MLEAHIDTTAIPTKTTCRHITTNVTSLDAESFFTVTTIAPGQRHCVDLAQTVSLFINRIVDQLVPEPQLLGAYMMLHDAFRYVPCDTMFDTAPYNSRWNFVIAI
jgi:hypothetical protein